MRLSPRRLPATTAAVTVFLTLSVILVACFLIFQRIERLHVRDTVEAVAAQTAARIRDFHADRALFLRMLADDLRARQTVDRQWFANEAARIRRGLAGIQAIIWIGPDGLVRWNEPTPEDPSSERITLDDRSMAPVIAAVARGGGTRMTPPFDLSIGGKGVVVLERLQGAEGLLGVAGVVYWTPAMEAYLLTADTLESYVFSVTDQGETVLGRGEVNGESPVTVALEVPVADRTWLLRMAPADPLPPGPFVLLIVGIALSLLVAIAVRTLMIRAQALKTEVAERRRAEEAMRAAKEEAERANTAKGHFLAAASHDLRQPLQAVNMFVHVLESRLTAKEDREVLDWVVRGLNSLNDLLKGLLDLSRLDAGTVIARREVFDLDEVFARLAEEFAPQAAARGLDCRFVSSGVHVESDPLLLYRVLLNLISNAVRYTPAGGRIVVGCRRNGDRVRIQVIDTGIGIPEDKLGRVFEEFYRIDGADQGGDKGFGLGLSLVRRLAALLDHEVRIRSTVDRGTTVEIVVPRRAVARASRPANEGGTAPLPTPPSTVIVVEDETAVREGLVRMLALMGCAFARGASAAEAIEDARRRGLTPEVVIADFALAENATGVAAVEQIRTVFGPVGGIILTGESRPEVLQQVRRTGLVLLHKPVTPAELHDALCFAMEAAAGGPERRPTPQPSKAVGGD